MGAPIARHGALETLRRPRFAGGRIETASVQAGRFVQRAGEAAQGLGREEPERCFGRGEGPMRYEDQRRWVAPRAAGAVRASLGLVPSFADVWAFREDARRLLT